MAPPADGQVVVVGDTHGQFHDVCRLLEVVGAPSPTKQYVFNGDFVDRGAWCVAAARQSQEGGGAGRCQPCCKLLAGTHFCHSPLPHFATRLCRRGLETLVLLAAWKVALPQAVFLLRGNHESATCTLVYGFKGELVAKYGKSHWRVRPAAWWEGGEGLPCTGSGAM